MKNFLHPLLPTITILLLISIVLLFVFRVQVMNIFQNNINTNVLFELQTKNIRTHSKAVDNKIMTNDTFLSLQSYNENFDFNSVCDYGNIPDKVLIDEDGNKTVIKTNNCIVGNNQIFK